jgi:hypothetical protein
MFKVGLTGGIASGKSTVCQLFSEYKVDIIDADIISKELVQPGQQCLSEIEDSFGSDFLTEKGELDRRRLRTFIFNDPTAKKTFRTNYAPAYSPTHSVFERTNTVILCDFINTAVNRVEYAKFSGSNIGCRYFKEKTT